MSAWVGASRRMAWQPGRRAVLVGAGVVVAALLSERSGALRAAESASAPGGERAADTKGPAQRATLYEEEPNNPTGLKFAGSARWSVATLPSRAGGAPEVAVRVDIAVPERRMRLRFELRRNTDISLPASHTAELHFTLPSGFVHGGIQNVPGLLMKASEQARGAPIAGVTVKVTDGMFMIGLSSADADRQRNIAMLKERAWIDVPVVYDDGRRAILAFEKGPTGERALSAAFAAWDGAALPAGEPK